MTSNRMERKPKTSLADILRNASDDTLAANGYHRKPDGNVARLREADCKPKPDRASVTSEHDEQVRLFKLSTQYSELDTMFAIPNGGHRSKATAGRLKAEGVKSGVPDIFLPVRSRGYGGMFIEMKVGRNKPTENQRDYMFNLSAAGYYCTTCYGADDALAEILWYIGKGKNV